MTAPGALTAPVDHESPLSSNPEEESRGLHLRHVIDHAAHLLPAQGPITVFIHHNTLHAFEDFPFTEALETAAKRFGCQPYLTEDRYREELARGRIRFADLEAVLREDLAARANDKILSHCTRLKLRLALLEYSLQFGPTEELLWFVAETDALRRVRYDASAAVRSRLIAETRRWVMRDLRGANEASRNGNGTAAFAGRQTSAALAGLIERFGEARIEEWSEATWEAFTLQALWRVCCDGVAAVPEFGLPPQPPIRHRDLLLHVTGADTDLLVHEVLIPFCGAYVDQGLAHWQLPRRDQGFYSSFRALHQLPGGPPEGWRRTLAKELCRLEAEHVGPLESIQESLDLLGVHDNEWADFLAATLLALRGWGGIIRFLEERPDRAVHPIPPGSLIEFLAIRLLLERLALQYTARQTIAFTGPLTTLRDELRNRIDLSRPPSVEQRAFSVFQLAQVLGWTPEELYKLGERDWSVLVREIEEFSVVERRRSFHLAYERRFYTQTLDALALHNRAPREEPRAPWFQAMFCIDEREESLRRHVEELAPDAMTFGIAGFYFVAMYYRGAADAHFVPLRPAFRVPTGLHEGKCQRGRVEPPAALVRVTLGGLLDQLPDRLELRAVRLGQAVQVEEEDFLAAGVVHPADKYRLRRNAHSAPLQALPDTRVVQYLCDGAAVRPSPRVAAGAAVVGRLVRVVHAGRAVAERQDQPGIT